MRPDEIRAWREMRALSQAELAELLSVDGTLAQATVSRWEAGERTPPPFLRLALDRLAMKHRPTRAHPVTRSFVANALAMTLQHLDEGHHDTVRWATQPGRLLADMDDLVAGARGNVLNAVVAFYEQVHEHMSAEPPDVEQARATLLAAQELWTEKA